MHNLLKTKCMPPISQHHTKQCEHTGATEVGFTHSKTAALDRTGQFQTPNHSNPRKRSSHNNSLNELKLVYARKQRKKIPAHSHYISPTKIMYKISVCPSREY